MTDRGKSFLESVPISAKQWLDPHGIDAQEAMDVMREFLHLPCNPAGVDGSLTKEQENTFVLNTVLERYSREYRKALKAKKEVSNVNGSRNESKRNEHLSEARKNPRAV